MLVCLSLVLCFLSLSLAQEDRFLSQGKVNVRLPVPAAPKSPVDAGAGVFTRLNPDFLTSNNNNYGKRTRDGRNLWSGSSFRTVERETSDLDQQQRRRPILRPGIYRPSLTGDAEPRSAPRPASDFKEIKRRPDVPASNTGSSFRSEDSFFGQRRTNIGPPTESLKRPQVQQKQPMIVERLPSDFDASVGRKVRSKRQSPHINPNVPLRCLQETSFGRCNETVTRYAYNQVSGKCETFEYSGCSGNRNNFITEGECRNRCGLNKVSTTTTAATPIQPNPVNQ